MASSPASVPPGSRPGRHRARLLTRQMARISALALAAALAGCAVGPDYNGAAISLPTSWPKQPGAGKAAVSGAPELAEWWTRLRDPTLNRLVDGAVGGSLDVAAARARVRQANASYDQAVGALFPTVDGSGSARRSLTGSTPSTPPYNNVRGGAAASWEVDLFGANRRAVEAAKYGLDASAEDLRNTLLVLIGDIASNYVDARGFQARIALSRRTAKSQRDTEALVRTRLAAGGATALDVANAAGQAASTEASIPALETGLAQAIHRLSVLSGQPPSTLADVFRKSAPIPAPSWRVRIGIPADVLLNRPDVRLAERIFAQSTAQIGQATAALYPSVSLTGDISTSAARFGDLGRSSSISWSFGPSLSVPLFNAGKLRAAVAVSEAQRDQSFIAWRGSVLKALEEVENALVSLNQEGVRISKLGSAASNYGEALRLSRELYQSGNVSFLDVLTAERSSYSAESALVDSRINRARAWIDLNKALGGGWSGVVDASRPEIVDRNTGPHFVRLNGAQP